MTQHITLLGATGSIGSSTLDVVSQHPDDYSIHALTANINVDALAALCEKWQPRFAVMNNADAAQGLIERLASKNINTQVLTGEDGLL